MGVSGVGRSGDSALPPPSGPSIEDIQKLISGYGNITSVQDAMKVIQALMEALEKDEAAGQAGAGGAVDRNNPYYDAIQKEIKNLKYLAAYLKDSLPPNSPDRAKLDTILQQLTKISTTPTLEDLKSLSTILTDLMEIGLTLPTTPIDQQRLFWGKMTTMFTDLKSFTQDAIATIDNEIAKLQEELKTLNAPKDQTQIELINKELMDKTKSKGELINAVFVFDSVKTLAQICSTNNLSLPDKFKEAILDVFMPAQEKILAQYAGELYYCNFSIRIYNQLSGITNTFNSADTLFAMSAEFRARYGSNEVNPGASNSYYLVDNQQSADQAIALFQKEKEEIIEGRANVEKAITAIDDAIKRVNDDDSLTDDQKSELKNKLGTIKESLQDADANLKNLEDYFKQLNINTIPDVSPRVRLFIISTNPPGRASSVISEIATREGNIINGSGTPRAGGLKVIANNINTDRTDYSNVSDQAQLEVTNAMTKIQQQWTIVATSLQLLNQMYMGLARAIRGG